MRHCGAALLMGSTESAGGGWGGESRATGANQIVLAGHRQIMQCHCKVQVAVGNRRRRNVKSQKLIQPYYRVGFGSGPPTR
jgi:hypothetical protein